MLRRYEMPWRPTYEAISAATWTASVPVYAGLTSYFGLPSAPFWYVAASASVFAGLRWNQAWDIWNIKLSLSGGMNETIDPADVAHFSAENKGVSGSLWLGIGFDWQPQHTQRLYEMKKIDPSVFYPPEWFVKLNAKIHGKMPAQVTNVGAPWIHGVEPNKGDVTVPFSNFLGHTIIFGTTGAGKTKLFELLMTQSIHRGDVVIMLDPKGDKDIARRAKIESERAGRRFVYVHLGFPDKSCRFDAMKNWNQPTEPASRIKALLPGATGGGDTFTEFAWNSVNSVVLGMLEIGEKPSLASIRRYIQNGVEGLLEKVLISFFDRTVEDWRPIAHRYVQNLHKDLSRPASLTERVKGYLMYFESELVAKGIHSDVIAGLADIYNHDAAWYSKMVASLIPVLSMLTSGELGALLSPDYDDMNDTRPIWDFEKIIASRCVLYIGLDALSNATVANAVGSLILSDAAAVAGARYNFTQTGDVKISMFVDEGSDVINDPFITILNKGRGADFVCWVATQTFPDFTAKLGNESKARKALGNFNNLIAMRTKDRTTQDFITETFGKRFVHNITTGQATGASSEENIAHFDGRINQSVSEKLEETIPSDVLGMLPNGEYIAAVAGGRIIKGKLPLFSD